MTPSVGDVLEEGGRCIVPGCGNITSLGVCDDCDQWIDEQVAEMKREVARTQTALDARGGSK